MRHFCILLKVAALPPLEMYYSRGYHRSQYKLDLSYTDEDLGQYEKLNITSPLFRYQWHLHNTLFPKVIGPLPDLNVLDLWEANITGKNVTVAIVDSGVLHDHGDLRENYSKETSYNFANEESDPSPLSDYSHGTRAAGLIAASKHGECGVGIAYDSKFSDLRISHGRKSSPIEQGSALVYKNQENHIYSASWGLDNIGKRHYRLPSQIKKALSDGAKTGRNKTGSIFVFAVGNSNLDDDFCSYDSIINSIYTIAVGAIDHFNRYATYSSTCSGLLVTSYSGLDEYGSIITSNTVSESADIFQHASKGARCTCRFTHTSASAPMVSGVIALLLQKKPALTWRDVQHLLIKGAVPVQLDHYSWVPTYSGLEHSTHFGFGRVDAKKLLQEAEKHQLVGPARELSFSFTSNLAISQNNATQSCFTASNELKLEHVTVTLDITHSSRKDLKVVLKSPSGFVSPLVFPREKDTAPFGYFGLTVLTLKHWNEPLQGEWCLIATDSGLAEQGFISKWSINFYGVNSSPDFTPIPASGIKNFFIPVPLDFPDIFKSWEERLTSTREIPRKDIPSQNPNQLSDEIPGQQPRKPSFEEPPESEAKFTQPKKTAMTTIEPEAQKHSNTFAESLMESERGNIMLIVGVASLTSFVLASFFVIRHCRGRSSRYKQI